MSDGGDDTDAKRGRSHLLQKTTVTQRLRASVQSVAVLPSRSSLRRGVSVSPARPICQNTAKPEADHETEEVATLYKQARKIIHLRHSVESPTNKTHTDSPTAKHAAGIQDSREVTPNCSAGSYPFKAPSPPASPRFQRWTRENSSEEVVPLPPAVSRGFSNARSVFCPASPSLFESQPCPLPQPPQAWATTNGCVLPRPWGDFTRGRLPTSVCGPRSFVRRSHSDHRPSLTFPPRTPKVLVAQSCGSEPSISTKGLEDGPTREEKLWDSQSDLRASNRSASHPDLCVVKDRSDPQEGAQLVLFWVSWTSATRSRTVDIVSADAGFPWLNGPEIGQFARSFASMEDDQIHSMPQSLGQLSYTHAHS
ncbi:hypothetical protein AAFF_G00387840 [Aldrovandia affinis]|uniref:Uncharacterized protein n=1 Tax=Aldrovandia affinis TaxID=143900 RepID=A0AAD7WLF0_9TELE|nr:hypothetical protein AAFF_G00387840 [Aldrovandia affinis]